MAFTHVGTVTNDSGSTGGTDLSITHGLTINAGDVVVRFLTYNTSTEVLSGLGTGGEPWIKPYDIAVTDETCRMIAAYKIAGSSEPATFAGSLTTSTQWRQTIQVFRPGNGEIPQLAVSAFAGRTAAAFFDYVCEAINGEVIPDDAAVAIAGFKDTRESANIEAITSANNSFTNVVGNTRGMDGGAASRIYTTGETASYNVTLESADGTPPNSDRTYSAFFGFVEGAAATEARVRFKAFSDPVILTSSASVTVDKPTGALAGELVQVSISTQTTNVTVTPPTGFVEIHSDGNTAGETRSLHVYYKILDGTEGATFAFTLSATAAVVNARAVLIQGVDPNNPIDAAGSAVAAENTPDPSIPSITTVSDNAMVMSTVVVTGTDEPFGQNGAPDSWVFTYEADTQDGAHGCAHFEAGAAGVQSGYAWDTVASSQAESLVNVWAYRPNTTVAFVVSTVIDSDAGASFSLSRPSGQVEGDVIVAAIALDNSDRDIGGPTGWTEIDVDDPNSTFSGEYSVWYTVVGSSPPSSDTWTQTGSPIRCTSRQALLRNIDPNDVVDAFAQNTTDNGAAPSVTVAQDNAMLLCFAFGDGGTGPAFTPPTGMNEVIDSVGTEAPSSGSNVDCGIASEVVSSGATGTKSFTFNGTIRTTFTVALNPIPALRVRSIASGINTGSNTSGTVHTLTLPAEVEAGDTLIAVLCVDANPATFTWPAGWTEIFSETSSASDPKIECRYKDSVTGAEDGTTIDVTTSSSQDSAFVTFSIAGAADVGTSPPEAATAATGLSVNPDPPANTPAGGAGEYLFLALHGNESGNQDTTAFPTDYYETGHENTESGGGGVGLGWAVRRLLSATTENPGTFTIENSRHWVAQTVAVYAAGLGGGNDLTAALSATLGIASALSGAGSVAAALPTSATIAADVTGSAPSDLAAALPVAATIAGDVSGAGELGAALPVTVNVAAVMDGAGTIAAALPVAIDIAATVGGPGDVAAALPVSVLVSSDLSGLGTLAAALGLDATIAANLEGLAPNELSSALNLSVGFAADLDAAGTVAAALAVTGTIAASIVDGGSERINAVLPISAALSPALSADGRLEAVITSTVSLAADAALVGDLEGALALTTSAIADLRATGSLSAAAELAVQMAAGLGAEANIAAALQMSAAILATVSDSNALTNAVATILHAAHHPTRFKAARHSTTLRGKRLH